MSRISRSQILGPAALALLPAGLAMAQSPAPDPYVPCTFYPQAPACEAVYRQALKDASPAAQSVKDAYEKYGRYVKTAASGLTQDDRKFLQDNQIELPLDLNAQDLGGLHNVINDPGLKDRDTKMIAVQNFLSRAVQAELYCGLSGCGPSQGTAS